MKILLTNDDGIFAEGLWTLAKELKNVAEVVVVTSDREQSAIGTAITLSHPLRVQKVRPLVPGTEAYSVEGTPGDSVILALEKLFNKHEIDLVVSGINQGLNLGNDVLISGTVGAALQGYLRGLPAIAVSQVSVNSPHLNNAAKMTALIAERIGNLPLTKNIFLNINLPELLPHEIKGIKITHLASESHIDTAEEGHDGKRKYYWLKRQRINHKKADATDIGAVEQGYVSITPLHAYLSNKPSLIFPDGLCSDLYGELNKNQE